MRKNLLTLMFSVTFIFLLAGVSLAETKANSTNSTKVLNSLSVAKNNRLNMKTLVAKHNKLKQFCNASAGWTCQSAFYYTFDVILAVTDLCSTNGWSSQTCGDHLQWQADTIAWYDGVCNTMFVKTKPPVKPIVNDSEKREIAK